MKNGLLLTLKQLIKLGVIKLKKKRKNKNKRLQQIEAFEKGVNDAVPINPQNKRYLYPPPASTSFQINSDALRVRDDNARLNVQKIENKNDIKNQKKIINEQEFRYKELANDVDIGRHFLMKYGPAGYAYDDDIVVSQTAGSDTFEPQTRMDTRNFEPQTIQELPYSAFKDTEEKQGNFSEDSTEEAIGKPFGMLTQNSDDEEEVTISKKKFKVIPTLITKTKDNKEKILESKESESELKPMNFPNIPVPQHDNYPFSPERIPYAKTKPSVVELEQWREWYQREGLKEQSILESNKRSNYIKSILKKMLFDYSQLRGEKDPSILKSKDPRIVYKAIKNRLSGVS